MSIMNRAFSRLRLNHIANSDLKKTTINVSFRYNVTLILIINKFTHGIEL